MVIFKGYINYGYLSPLMHQFWINFEVGSRTNNTANRLVQTLKLFGNWTEGKILKITTDKLAAYKNAIFKHFPDIPYKYLQIVKL